MVAMGDSSGTALAAGRFAGWEPLGFEAGDENWYRFVANEPTEKTDPSGLAEYSGWSHWSITAKDISDGVWTTSPIQEDRPDTYPHTNLMLKGKSFTLEIQFKFDATAECLIPPHRVGKPGCDPKNRPDFWPNSGVYIYNTFEVQIYDASRLESKPGYIDPTKSGSNKDSPTIDTLVPGWPYGLRNAGFNMPFEHHLRPCGNWNTLKMEVLPRRSGEGYEIDLKTWVNDKSVFAGTLNEGTGSGKTRAPWASPPTRGKPALGAYELYLQSHWGSKVQFQNPTIRVHN
jgi:hypothetical protein